MTIVGTRPEIIKLSLIIKQLDQHMDQILVHTGQNYDYELNEIFFEDLEIRKPDYFLDAAGDNAAQTIGNIIIKADQLMSETKPDAILLYGDTNSCLSVISAKRRKIPIFHMEAGNRCFDQRVPEEINRKIVDHLSDINMVHSEHARRYLLSEGLPAQRIIKTGSPMREVLDHFKGKIEKSQILQKLGLKKKDYFIVSIHREENLDYKENFEALLNSLYAMAITYGKRIIVSTHPRTRKKIDSLGEVKKFHELIEFMKPLGFLDYVALQMNSICVVSDSGTITEESSLLNFPAIMVRMAHERPEGMDVGSVIMSGLDSQRVLDSIGLAMEQQNYLDAIDDYKFKNVSTQVIRIIQSYTDYVDRTVWLK